MIQIVAFAAALCVPALYAQNMPGTPAETAASSGGAADSGENSGDEELYYRLEYALIHMPDSASCLAERGDADKVSDECARMASDWAAQNPAQENPRRQQKNDEAWHPGDSGSGGFGYVPTQNYCSRHPSNTYCMHNYCLWNSYQCQLACAQHPLAEGCGYPNADAHRRTDK